MASSLLGFKLCHFFYTYLTTSAISVTYISSTNIRSHPSNPPTIHPFIKQLTLPHSHIQPSTDLQFQPNIHWTTCSTSHHLIHTFNNPFTEPHAQPAIIWFTCSNKQLWSTCSTSHPLIHMITIITCLSDQLRTIYL